MSDYALLSKSVDRLGRPTKDLHRLGDSLLLTTKCAEWGIPIKLVPGPYWALDADADGEPEAIVSCPCGHDHRLSLLEGPHTSGTPDCQRGYVFDGESVWVLNSPTQVVAE